MKDRLEKLILKGRAWMSDREFTDIDPIENEGINSEEEQDSPLAKEDKAITDGSSEDSAEDSPDKVMDSELETLKQMLAKRDSDYKDLVDRTQRLAAEFDNFKKRTQKEKEKLFCDSSCDVVAKFLPVVDNLERAIKASEADDGLSLKEGVSLVFKQLSDILDKLDVKTIEAIGKTFDPELHHAVMHVEDDNYGVNEIIDEFQKGYTFKDDTIIRYSMVKVAN